MSESLSIEVCGNVKTSGVDAAPTAKIYNASYIINTPYHWCHKTK